MNIIEKIQNLDNIWEILPQLTVKELENAIKIANDWYHNTSEPLISDQNYDILVEKLKELNPTSTALKQTGSQIKGKKVKLPYWLGSMDKIKSDQKLITSWVKNYKGPYLVSDKLDGVTGLLVILNGRVFLYTRGDGQYGQDISHLVNLFNMSIKKLLKMSINVVLRGELIMSKKNFEKYKNEMANARNMVAGIVNSKPLSVNKEHAADVDFIAYEIIDLYEKPSDQMKLLIKWGLNTVYYDIYPNISVDILNDVLKTRKQKSIYEIDGIIVTDDNKYTRNKSGNPSYAFAYKGLSETANVKVLEVIWKASKDGYLVPTVRFEKVKLSGAELQMTAGFNAKFIIDNKLGKGAIIKITRSGDVIPYIMGIVKPAKKVDLPNEDYEWDKNHVNIVLTNPDENEDVIIGRLTKFARYLGIENMSEGLITRLVKAGYDTIPKIILLTIDDMLSLDGFQQTLATKLYNNLHNALNDMDILTLMVASNIFGHGFGKRKIKKILDVYPNIVTEYTNKTRNAWINKLMQLEGFDTITVEKFIEALPHFQTFYKEINKLINIKPYTNQDNKNGLFKDQVVVMTGFRSDEIQKFIENEGGRIASSVSNNTTLLIYNDGEESSAKYKKAKNIGINTISKSQFSKKYNIY